MITLKYLVLGLTHSGFGLRYLLGLGMNQSAVAIVESDECGGFGDTRPEKCPAVRSTPVRFFLLAMAIVNTVNLTV